MEISGAERGRGRRIVVGTCLITSANTDTSAIIYTVRGGGSGGADDWLCFMLMKLDQLQVNFSRRTLRILGPIIHLNYTRFHLFYYIGRRDSDKRLLYARLWRGRVSVPCRSSRECVRACVPAWPSRPRTRHSTARHLHGTASGGVLGNSSQIYWKKLDLCKRKKTNSCVLS